MADLIFAGGLGFGAVVAEAGEDLVVFEVEAFDGVIGAAELDGGPVDDAGGTREGIAEVGLLEDFFGAGAGAAVGEELVTGKAGAAGAVEGIEEAEVEGVGHGDAVIQIPQGAGDWSDGVVE